MHVKRGFKFNLPRCSHFFAIIIYWVYNFSVAPSTKYHELGPFKEQKLIVS